MFKNKYDKGKGFDFKVFSRTSSYRLQNYLLSKKRLHAILQRQITKE